MPTSFPSSRLGQALTLAFMTGLALLVGAVFPRVADALTVPSQFVVENAIAGVTFNTPVQVTFLPGGRWLVVEKRGTVWVVQNGVKLATPFFTRESEVLDNGDRGLLSVAVDSSFATNRYVYFLYTVDPDSNGTDDNDDAFGRLTRYQASTSNPNVVDYTTRTVLIGHDWRHGIPSGSPSHTIGTVRMARDGTLLISAGDGAQFTNPADQGGRDAGLFGAAKTDPNEDIGSFRAQFIGSLAGKILRIDRNGSGLPSNPFYQASDPTSNQSRVWCFGLRNPYRFALRPGTGSTDPNAGSPGTLYIGEVGWTAWEEQNIAAVSQRNFGWPCYEGLLVNGNYQNLSPAHDGCNTLGSRPVLTAPSIAYPHDSALPSTPSGMSGNTAIGGAFYTASQYPQQYRGQYFFGDYGQSWVRVATVDGNNNVLSVASFGTAMESPVDFEADPANGDILYVSVGTGQVRRIRWTGAVDNNRPPVANALGAPTSGTAPLTVNFTGSGTDPDGDPLTYAWTFGDAGTSTAQSPSHLYSSAGTFNAILSVSDGRGGLGRDTVVVVVNGTGSGFPSTAVLDNFNRANGAIGSAWVDPVYANASLSINSNALTQTCCIYGTPIWAAQSFGPDQEAFVTLAQLTAGAPEHDLQLKLQSANYNAAHIEVRYDAGRSGVYVATYDLSAGWIDRGTPIATTFAAGDRLGARAYANGTVEVYKNATMLGSRSVTGWAYAALGGFIGLTLDGATQSRLDDFGGGNINLNINTKPTAVIEAPANNSFFYAGQNVAMTGHGTDAQDAVAALNLHWQVNLHHNTHVHPAVFQANGTTATYVGEDHDDGTGVFAQLQLHVTDTGGLVDTARVNIYPEVDLSPSLLAVAPAVPTTASPLTVTFRISNTGRMPAPITRWRVRAGNTVLAERDTLVPALSSVQVTAIVTPSLAAGTYALRATVDTLAKAFETIETNNAQTIPLTIGPGPNRPPIAQASGTPTTGSAPLTVAFSSAGSSDPDGDPLGYAWAFGDGTTSTAASPSKTYNAAGSYSAVLTVTDGRNGSAQATVPITVTTGPPGFPATAVLDNFDRANGPVGATWVGDVNGFVVTGNAATQNCCYVSAVWNGAVFGADQEAYYTFSTLGSSVIEQDLMLKVQGTSYTSGHIEVRYDANPGRVQVSTYQNGSWTNRGASISTTFAAGDRFGARALANGTVNVYKNATLLGSRSITAWPFYNLGGRIGLTLEGASSASFENYGGGTVPAGALAMASEALPAPDLSDSGETRGSDLPGNVSLSNAYPSPTTGRALMNLSLPRETQVQFSVHDVQGREVWREDRSYGAGRWTLAWSGQGAEGGRRRAGIYLARVRVGGEQVFVRRIALLP